MTRILFFCLFLISLKANAGDVEQIQGLYQKWRDAVATADIPAYVSVLDPEVRLIPPGADPIDGAAHYANFLKPVFEAASYRIEVASSARIEVLGDIAVAEYAYVIHLELKDPSQGITEAGALTESRTEARYFDVLKRSDTGEFRVWRHTWQ